MADKPIFCYPISNYVTITQRFWANHAGLDFGWSGSVSGGCNQGLISIADGVVVTAQDGYGNTYPNSRIYGNYVVVRHADGWYSLYGHLLKGLKVRTGQTVKQGQVLGYMGNTGYSNGQHLHFELRKGGNSKAYSVDPMDWLYIMPELIAPIVSKQSLMLNRIKYLTPTPSVGTPVQRNTEKDQLEITVSNLNGRYYPKLDSRRWGYVTKGIYNIHNRIESGGYTWYMLDPNQNGVGDALWVAYSPAWAVLMPVETGDEVAGLRARVALLEAEKAKLTDLLSTQASNGVAAMTIMSDALTQAQRKLLIV